MANGGNAGNHIVTTNRTMFFGDFGKIKYRHMRTKIKADLNGRRLERHNNKDK